MDHHYLKDLKKAYRILRKEKNKYKKGDEKRIELNKKMKELKEKIETHSGGDVDAEKQQLIDKITEFKTANKLFVSDMRSFSKEQLEFHYMKITGAVKTKEEFHKIKGTTQKTSETTVQDSHSLMESSVKHIKRKTNS